MVGVGGSYRDPLCYPSVPYVATDNHALVDAAFQHLQQKGLERFAFYGSPANSHTRWAKEREQAMMSICQQHGYPCSVYRGHTTQPQTWQYSIEQLANWVGSLAMPIGIVAVTDARARHLLQVCDHFGIYVPDNVAIVGIDDDEVCQELESYDFELTAL